MKTFQKLTLYCLLFFFTTSCVKEVDFNQVKNFSATPVFTTSLSYFTVNQKNFIKNAVEISAITDISSFTFLKSKFVKDNLVKVELDFKINNQFDRDFKVTVDFLDDTNQITYSFSPLNIRAYNSNFQQLSTIHISNNILFLSSTKIRIKLQLSAGTPLDPDDLKTLNFKSAATVYLKT